MTGWTLGPDGVAQIYQTKPGGTGFYLNLDDPYSGGAYTSRSTAQFNISFGKGSQLPFTKHIDTGTGGLIYFNTTGSPVSYKSGGSGRTVRLDCYPDGGKWNNRTTYHWQNNPGYLYTDNSIGSGEFTTYVRVHGNRGTHQAYAHKIGGRDEDPVRSVIEMVYPTSSHSNITVNYNYAHFPYVSAKPTLTIPNALPLADNGDWIGLKTVHKIAADKSFTDWEMWVDVELFNTNAPANNWILAATYYDLGCSDYNNIPLTWKCHKDLCRVDGFESVDFTLISDRAIEDI